VDHGAADEDAVEVEHARGDLRRQAEQPLRVAWRQLQMLEWPGDSLAARELLQQVRGRPTLGCEAHGARTHLLCGQLTGGRLQRRLRGVERRAPARSQRGRRDALDRPR
jgi:hypothetical protein